MKEKVNYSEQMDYLIPSDEKKRNRMKDILERAGFSRNDISMDDYTYADGVVEDIFKSDRKK